MWLRGRSTPTAKGERVKKFFEDAGPLWIKVGQLLALRTDLFAIEFCQILGTLQFRAGGFPTEAVRAVIQEDLGATPEELFTEFDPLPFAGASLAQVHKAMLPGREGWWVVKVQRPDVVQVFERDMSILATIIGFIQWTGYYHEMRWEELMSEIRQVFLEETDYRYESANTARMGKVLRPRGVVVPRVSKLHCTRRLVVMEYVDGVVMSDYIAAFRKNPDEARAWARANNIRPSKVARRLFLTFLRQIFEDNFFHGDLHPGNILLLKNGRFAFIDFGTVGSMDADFVRTYYLSLRSQAQRQYTRSLDYILLLCPELPPYLNLPRLREQFTACFRRWELKMAMDSLDYHERSLMAVSQDISLVLGEHRVITSWALVKVSRTWSTLDGSLAYLIPMANYGRLLLEYFARADARAASLGSIRHALPILTTRLHEIARLLDVATEAGSYLGPIQRKRALAFEAVNSKIAYVFATTFRIAKYALWGTCLVLLYRFVEVEFGGPHDLPDLPLIHQLARMLPRYEYEVEVGSVIVLFYLGFKSMQLTVRFREKDSPDQKTA
jgi:ubiquinone biosynthesis protein